MLLAPTFGKLMLFVIVFVDTLSNKKDWSIDTHFLTTTLLQWCRNRSDIAFFSLLIISVNKNVLNKKVIHGAVLYNVSWYNGVQFMLELCLSLHVMSRLIEGEHTNFFPPAQTSFCHRSYLLCWQNWFMQSMHNSKAFLHMVSDGTIQICSIK